MTKRRDGQIAVIFASVRTGDDEEGYRVAAAAMAELAARQPGYRGIASVRDAAGAGITISYWASHDDAAAWRDHPDHARVRDAGRDRWYTSYSLDICDIQRSYHWTRND